MQVQIIIEFVAANDCYIFNIDKASGARSKNFSKFIPKLGLSEQSDGAKHAQKHMQKHMQKSLKKLMQKILLHQTVIRHLATS